MSVAAPSGLAIRHVAVPDSVDDPDFRAVVDICNAVEADIVGHDQLSATYAEYLSFWQPDPTARVTRTLAVVDELPVGRGFLKVPLAEAPDLYAVAVEVLPQHRGRGVGTAILRQLEHVARREGRTRAQTWAMCPAVEGETLAATTGFGSVPAAAPSTRFLREHGFTLEQVMRMSELDLRAGDGLVDGALAEAQAAATDYRVHTWRGRTPPAWAADLAWMHSRMSTDAPAGGLQVDEEQWDVERLADFEAKEESEDRYLLTSAAEHLPSGRLVAFTSLGVPVEAGRLAWQSDTLVVREHRGHQLGLLVKATNLVAMRTMAAGASGVVTWNAEENRPMLDVNERLGFRATGYEGAWERRDA